MNAKIGLMIGFFIITRMASILFRKGERKEHVLIIILAGITIACAMIVMLYLFVTGILNTDVRGYLE